MGLYTLKVSTCFTLLSWTRCHFNGCRSQCGTYLHVIFLSAREPLPTWDKQIQSLCFQVNNLLEKIRQAAPEWAAQAMETQMTQWTFSLHWNPPKLPISVFFSLLGSKMKKEVVNPQHHAFVMFCPMKCFLRKRYNRIVIIIIFLVIHRKYSGRQLATEIVFRLILLILPFT